MLEKGKFSSSAKALSLDILEDNNDIIGRAGFVDVGGTSYLEK